MIGEADIEDVDSRSWKVTARTYHVQCSADVMGRTDDLLLQAVTRQQVVELNGMWIVLMLQPKIQISGEHKRHTVQYARKFSEEVGGHGR